MITGQIDSGRTAPGKIFGGAGAGGSAAPEGGEAVGFLGVGAGATGGVLRRGAGPAAPEGSEAMRFLVVGAGATGGYFGGRLLEAGRDVTFLVRPGRAERLAATGLVLRSPAGDASLPPPPTVLASDLRDAFDVVILS